jgi:hypothetical protein
LVPPRDKFIPGCPSWLRRPDQEISSAAFSSPENRKKFLARASGKHVIIVLQKNTRIISIAEK